MSAMNSFDRAALPDTESYFEAEGFDLKGPGKWKTTRCDFHGGSDSMRVNTEGGGWVCMASDELGISEIYDLQCRFAEVGFGVYPLTGDLLGGVQ